MATELSVVNRLHALSGDVANQPYIARRGILPTLKKFLASENLEVQIVAAKTLRLLASHPDNPDYIAQEAGIVATVLSVYDQTESKELKEELTGIMAHLKSAVPAQSQQQASPGGKQGDKPGKAYPSVPEQHKKQVAPRNKPTERAKIQRRHMILKAPSVTAANVDDLEHLLQNIRGMISYSIDTQQQTLNLFLSTPKHILLKHLKDVGFECEILEEQLAKAQGSTGGSAPSYLSSGTQQESDYKRSLVLTGDSAKDAGGSSLAARLKEKHKNRNKASEEEKNSVSGFFSGLARTLLS